VASVHLGDSCGAYPGASAIADAAIESTVSRSSADQPDAIRSAAISKLTATPPKLLDAHRPPLHSATTKQTRCTVTCGCCASVSCERSDDPERGLSSRAFQGRRGAARVAGVGRTGAAWWRGRREWLRPGGRC
jgi:hypothetical protein